MRRSRADPRRAAGRPPSLSWAEDVTLTRSRRAFVTLHEPTHILRAALVPADEITGECVEDNEAGRATFELELRL